MRIGTRPIVAARFTVGGTGVLWEWHLGSGSWGLRLVCVLGWAFGARIGCLRAQALRYSALLLGGCGVQENVRK